MTLGFVHDDNGPMAPDPITEQFERFRRRGDLEALGAVFDATGKQLLPLALHLCGNAADAEDALQATFVVAMQKADTFDGKQPVGPWLAGILAGEARNLARRERRRRGGGGVGDVGSEPMTPNDPAAEAERRDQIAMLRTHIDALADEQRQVLLLQLQHGLQPAEIAEVLGVPPGTVRMRLHRGLQALRGVLPASLLAMFVALLPARGIAAVRTAVLREAAAFTKVGAFTIGGVVAGGLLMKKVLAAVVGLALLALGTWALQRPDEPDAPTLGESPPAQVQTASLKDAQPAAEGTSRTASATEAGRVAVAPQPGALGVVLGGVVWTRENRRTWSSISSGLGTPLRDVLVEVWRGGDDPRMLGAEVHTGRTDAHGRLVLTELPAGEWRVAVSSAGERSGTKTAVVIAGAGVEFGSGVRPARGAVVEFQLGMKSLRGRVVDAHDAPVAGAEIWAGLRTGEDARRQLRCLGVSATDGAFAVDTVQGEQLVQARKPGYSSSWSHSVDQLGGGDVTLRLGGEPGEIVATLAAPPGVAFPAASVQVQWDDNAARRDLDGSLLSPPLVQIAIADGPARFVARGLAPGEYQVALRWPGRVAATTLQVAPGGTAYTSFHTVPLAVVSGRVRGKDGAAKTGLHVMLRHSAELSGRTVVTDAGGGFRFEGIEPGPIVLAASRLSSGVKSETRFLVPIGSDYIADLVLDETSPLRGRLVDAAGNAVGGYYVFAIQGEATHSSRTDGDGRFTIWGLDDAAARFEVARPPMRSPNPRPPLLTEHVARVDAAQALELTLPAAATSRRAISGRIVDEHGAPVATAFVELPESAPPPPGPNVDAQGCFRLDAPHVGPGTLEVEADGFMPRRVGIEVVAGEVTRLGDVVLARTAELRVRFLRPDGTAWGERPPTPQLLDTAGSEPEGVECRVDGDAVVVTTIAAGRYRVALDSKDELLAEPQDVELCAGAPTTITMATALGRRRYLHFEGPTATAAEPDAEVEVRRADGGVAFRGGAERTVTGWVTGCVLPLGELTVQARVAGRVSHRAKLTVTAALDASMRVTFAPLP